jgi:hypothetical protein
MGFEVLKKIVFIYEFASSLTRKISLMFPGMLNILACVPIRFRSALDRVLRYLRKADVMCLKTCFSRT